MYVSPKGDAGAVVGLPHQREDVLVLLLLLCVAGNVDIQLRDEHGHLEGVLLLLHSILQVADADVRHVVRLVAVGVDGRSCIAKCADELDVVVKIPSERVVVVIDENGIWPALIGHLEGFDEPVVARLATTAQTLLHHGIAVLVHADGLVYHVDHG